jgi:DNA-binding NarL/FixJ family response regulator
MRRARVVIARAGSHSVTRVDASHLSVEEVSQMPDLIAAIASRRPAVLLLSIDFPGLGGPPGIRDLRRLNPSMRIIVLSRAANDQEELECLRMGVKGYCGVVETNVLLKMIDKVQEGEIWAARKTIGALVDEFYAAGAELADRTQADSDVEKTLQSLTFREGEILRLLAAGASNKEIAGALNVTVSTIKAHLTKMFRKLGQPDRLHLALYAVAARRASH